MQPQVPTTTVAELPPDPAATGVLLDVREEDEWRAGHAPGAVHVRLDELPARVAELDAGARVAVVCRAGGRSAQAVAWLAGHGVDAVNVAGGMTKWQAAGRPLVSEDGTQPRVI